MKSIKPAGVKDIPLIRELAYKIWPEAYGAILSPGQLTYMLEKMYNISSLETQITSNNHNFILVLDNDIPVGFASFSPKKEDPSVIRLHKIYILPQQQGTGTGKYLLQEVVALVKKSGGRTIELNVNRHNKARFFYEKLGFIITRKEDIDIGEGYFMNDFIMELHIT